MKHISSYAALLFAASLATVACSDDHDSNPTMLSTPSGFTLNEISATGGLIDMEASKSLDLTWSQPKFTDLGAPVVATYTVQLSTTGQFSQLYDAAADDNSAADFIALDETYTTCAASVSTEAIDRAMVQLNAWAETEVPDAQELHLRIKAAVRDASFVEYGTIVSNVLKFTVSPYYIELKDATPIMWYLVGNLFGGKWGSDVGNDALPMFLKPDYTYDKKTGAGEIEYTNYFITGDYDNTNGNESSTAGFKIQPSDFNWDLGMTGKGDGSKGTIIYRNKGEDGGHIVAPEDGYYTVTMNTADNTATMTKYEGDVTVYSSVALSGSFNGWDRTEMLPYNKEGVENHAWYLVIEATEDLVSERGNVEFKFRTGDDWLGFGTSDGTYTTYGTAGSGSNLGLPVGATYVISFNDITKAFSIQVK